MASNRSYGGSSLSFSLNSEAHLEARIDGLYLLIVVNGTVHAVQVIQWDQVDAWMEAAEAGEREELIETSQRGWAIRERARRAALKRDSNE